ncbi:18897_t:CDS:1 [Racocetra fulgida]|uniref:18897_t:CDS:1 n=1 Tax=Racocetra fulgida TaxID=60492 RepID=A0A9N9F6B4_9GLOM|nr:18897_t:CDS:1 [Racocetra fulgida]
MLVIQYGGQSLREILRRMHPNKFTWKDVVYALRDISRGLVDIHHQNLIHGNLHSGNILISNDGTYFRITDLGICWPINQSYDSYLAPEILNGDTYTQAADIYSIGSLMYELVTGYPPIRGKIDTEFALSAPEFYQELINQCWHHVPMNRPSARQIYDKFVIWWSGGQKIVNLGDAMTVTSSFRNLL